MLESKAQVIEMANDLKIKIAGLDRMPEFGLCPTRVQIAPGQYQEVPGRFYTMSTMDEGKTWMPIKEVSEKYELVQHYEALGALLEGLAPHMGDFGTPTVKLQFSGVGNSRMFNDVRWKDMPIVVNNDKIIPIFRQENSVDTSRRFLSQFRAERQVCTNGMTVPDDRFPNKESVRKLHKTGVLNLDTTLSIAMDNMTSFVDTINKWDGWSKIALPAPDFQKIVEKELGYSEKQIETITETKLIGFDGTLKEHLEAKKEVDLWTGYNAVTQFITHNTENPATEADRSRAASDSFEKRAAA